MANHLTATFRVEEVGQYVYNGYTRFVLACRDKMRIIGADECAVGVAPMLALLRAGDVVELDYEEAQDCGQTVCRYLAVMRR